MNSNYVEFSYDPLSEEDAQKERYHMLEDGIYPATIEYAYSKLSTNGNPMGVFTLSVWTKEGNKKEITDYIPSIKSMAWKMRHLCESAGLIKEYDDRTFKPELSERRNVLVSIKTQKGKDIPVERLDGKPYGSKYPDRNVIDDYISKDKAVNSIPTSHTQNSVDQFYDDKLPF